MPEGPEVKVVGDSLHKWLVGQKIDCIEFSPEWISKHPFDTKNLQFPLTVNSVKTHGKCIIISIGQTVIVSHLGMSGQWFNDSESSTHQNHLHIKIKIGNLTIFYRDPRRFGQFKQQSLDLFLKKLGPDLLASDFTLEIFMARVELYLQKKKKASATKIADLLLDQAFIAGVGNYIRCDALYIAKVNPLKVYNQISQEEWKAIFVACKTIATKSYLSQGHSITAYTNGRYSPILYGRQFSPCNKPVQKQASRGRTLHYINFI
jgi:DNA-formamidopyrimidine glycosylase